MAAANDERRVRSFKELPQSLTPPDRVWAGIAAEIEAEASGPVRASRRRPPLLAAAAVVMALLVGVIAGRWLLPGSPGPHGVQGVLAQQAQQVPQARPDAVPVSFIRDPRYLRQREQLLAGLSARVAALPPESRQKVLSSLATLQQSIRDLQAALGRDPSNALLQELLVDSCQDEMRVLVAVNEAGQDAAQL